MKRSLQEYVELVVFGLVALLVGTGLLWLVGWLLSVGGIALKWVAGLLWNLLRFIVPVAIAGGLVYFLVKAAQDRQAKPATAGAGTGSGAAGTYSPSTGSAATTGAQQPTTTPTSPGQPTTSTTTPNYVSTPPAGTVDDTPPPPDPAAPDVTADLTDTPPSDAYDIVDSPDPTAAADVVIEDDLGEDDDKA